MNSFEDRSGHMNLYERVQKTRLTKKERDSEEHIVSFVHEDLLNNERFTIKKFNTQEFKRGLQEDEHIFP